MRSARRLIEHYRKIVRAADTARNLCYCWRYEKDTGLSYTDQEKSRLKEAQEHFEKAFQIVNEIFSKRIGETVTKEVRSGEWR